MQTAPCPEVAQMGQLQMQMSPRLAAPSTRCTVAYVATTRTMIKGPTRDRVAHNLRSHREAGGWSLTEVSGRLVELGHPLGRTGLHRLETGARAATVDDLVALALALDCSPLALLLPSEDTGEPMKITSGAALKFDDVWRWARGKGTSRPKLFMEGNG